VFLIGPVQQIEGGMNSIRANRKPGRMMKPYSGPLKRIEGTSVRVQKALRRVELSRQTVTIIIMSVFSFLPINEISF